jgi:Fe-S-cluster-containing dehydrogenase component/formate-dependent nitrite reductase membrane component NrfD
VNFGFIIDNRKCIGCHACTVACKAEHDVPVGVNRTWVKYVEKGEYPNSRRLFSVMRCNHCDDAPCVEICPVEALHTRDDGIVDFDNRRCIGCKACMQACPYDALYIDPETHTAAKCNYCAHRVDIGLEPACVNVCPEHAIISGDMDDPNSEISLLLSREQVHARKVEKGTRPKLFYIDGDAASLVPTATAPSANYMWSSQAAGVGHFAKYAESLLAKSDPLEMVKKLNNGVKDPTAVYAGKPGVSLPDDIANTVREKTEAVIKENARRAYDAPTKGAVWGWEVSAYVWTKAIAAGAFLLPFIGLWLGNVVPGDTAMWSGWGASLIFLALTGLLLIKDLDKPARFAYVLLRPQWRSWLVKGGYAITVYGGLLALWGHAKYWQLPVLQQLAEVAGVIFAVIVAIYTAFLFAQAKGRDFWQSPALPLHMLVHALMAGAAFFALLTVGGVGASDWQQFTAKMLNLGIIANLVVIAIELLTPHPTTDAKRAVAMITKGRFRNLFYAGTLLLGNLLPLALLGFFGVEMLPLAGALTLVGIYITEHIWIRAPQLIPLS